MKHDYVHEWYLAELLQAAGKSKRKIAFFLRGYTRVLIKCSVGLGATLKIFNNRDSKVAQLNQNNWPTSQRSLGKSIHLWF